MAQNQTANILWAEDCEDDVFFLSRAFERAGISHVLIRVRDGQEAITYLSEKPRPDVILLDLRMPGIAGFELLKWIRERPELKDLPVIVLTASNLPADMTRARQMGALDFLVKGTAWTELAGSLQSRFAEILAARR